MERCSWQPGTFNVRSTFNGWRAAGSSTSTLNMRAMGDGVDTPPDGYTHGAGTLGGACGGDNCTPRYGFKINELFDGASLWAALARSLVRAAAATARHVMASGVTASLHGALLWAALARSLMRAAAAMAHRVMA